MHNNEWSLVIFTVLVQMAVGAFLTVQAMAALFVVDESLINSLLLLCWVVLVIGVPAATMHLGRIGRVPGVMANLPSSWLSREMLLGGLFGVLLTVYVAVRGFDAGTQNIQELLAGVTGFAGIALVIGMSRLYMLRTVPAWNTVITPLAFLTTTFLLGALLVATVCVAVYPAAENSLRALLVNDALQVIAPLVLLLAVLQILFLQQWVAELEKSGGVALKSVHTLVEEYQTVFFWRLFLVGLGAGLFTVMVIQDVDFTGNAAMRGLLMLAFALVLVAEMLGRFLFYASYQREGI